MSLSFIDHLRSELDHIKQDGLYKAERVLTSPQQARIAVQSGAEVLNFCANNYLGLANHPRLIRRGQANLRRAWLWHGLCPLYLWHTRYS